MYCRQQLVELREDYEKFQALGAQILAVSTDDLSQAEYAVERLGLQFPILQDLEGRVSIKYGVFDLLNDGVAAPSTFLLDKDGAIRWQYIGKSKSDRPSNSQIIRQLQGL